MAELDESGTRLTIKLVYYGPAQSGKTTNLTYFHDHLSPELKGEMMALETKGDRTLFFDLLPMGMKCPSGLLIKLKLFTVPGQVAHDSTRKAVLSRADGVVFVADSQRNQSMNNLESFENLAANIGRVGLDMDTLPIAIQFNKRDLPADAIVSEEEVLSRWSKMPWPVTFASALKGYGVSETFAKLLASVYTRVDGFFDLTTEHGITAEAFIHNFSGATEQEQV
ncbi:MAG: GTPase domain-containing protein [Oleiphilaceae bacterium]|nr:GTPase domain-containing protein [Oleiphilaceae bacterium]